MDNMEYENGVVNVHDVMNVHDVVYVHDVRMLQKQIHHVCDYVLILHHMEIIHFQNGLHNRKIMFKLGFTINEKNTKYLFRT